MNTSYMYNIGNAIGSSYICLLAVFISYLPIYKKNISENNILKHLIDIVTNKNTICNRGDYIVFSFISLTFLTLSGVILFFVDITTSNSFVILCIFALYCIINFIFTTKRLENANISKLFLLSYLFSIFGASFFWLAELIIFILCMFPEKEDKNKED